MFDNDKTLIRYETVTVAFAVITTILAGIGMFVAPDVVASKITSSQMRLLLFTVGAFGFSTAILGAFISNQTRIHTIRNFWPVFK